VPAGRSVVGESEFEVVWPSGRSAVSEVGLSEALDGIDGKTIGFVWDHVFRGAEMWEIIKERLSADYPGTRFVDYPVFGDIHGSVASERAAVAGIPDKLREYRVDAAIVGVGA
jgi:hypothetical protein